MTCAKCGRANPTAALFCGGCGTALVPRCPACGAEGAADAQFCIACGSPLAAPRPAEAAAERKVVTIVFADLIGSTALHEGLDPESVNRLMDRYHRAVRAPVEANGGTVVQLLGDGVMCAFGVPRVAEDDAIRAVRAGVAIQQAFREFARGEGAVAERIGLRVAINTGEVVVSDDYAAGIGDPLNVAARLQQEAQDGDVLVSGSTQRLVSDRVSLEPVGRFALKGRSEPVTAYRVVSLERPASAPAIGFVGREEELARVTAVYETAVAAPAARLAVVMGSPGLGKSRLVVEFVRRLGDRAAVLTAQCNAAAGATFAPLADALRTHLELGDSPGADAVRAAIDAVAPGGDAERARIAAGIAALLAGTPSPPEETFFVIRRLLAALAVARPVVVVIDDLQWAEPLLLDLTEHLVQWGSGVPLLVLAAARPELRDARSSLATPGGLVTDVVTLAGLDANAATRLAAKVVGADALPAAVAGRVLSISEGNPLFLGELVRMLVQDGALRREGDRWSAAADLADLPMPPTIHALLAARIERLRPEDRVVLELASIVGRHFSRGAVAHLLPPGAQADLDARLESLRRSELVESDTGWLLGEPVLRFHHVLIRDAAYRRLLRNTRAELHERFADWLVHHAGESVEHDETIGWHLEQAHQQLRELGPLDARGLALGQRAARYLSAAGRRALGRDDLLPAAGLLGRALDRLGGDDPTRADLVLDWCEALLAAGDVVTGGRAIAELARLMPGSERLRGWHTCFAGQLAVLADPKTLRESEGAVARAAETMAAAGDAAGEAKAHWTHALVLAQLGKIGPCEAALDRALAAARRTPERRLANAVLAGAPLAALWGPSPVTRASGRCLDVVRVLRITQGAPAVEAVALRCQAVLETLRGRGEAARRMIASSRKLVEELGITQRVLEADEFAGLIELLEGDAPAAERWLRSAWTGLRDEGLGIEAAVAGALLARALLAQGHVDEAERVSRESEALAGDSFKAAIAWRGVRAEVLAARGDHAAAAEVARAAVAIAAATDDLLDHADARASLAVALRAAGRGTDADAEERRAIELWEAKGATLLVERARRAPAIHPPEPAAVPTPIPRTTMRRRTASNHATRHMALLDGAVAARDLDAVARLLGDARLVDHVHGHAYGADALLDRFRWLERSADLTFRNEPIAVLGPSLALARWRETGAGVVADELMVGSYETGGVVLIEADCEGRMQLVESFAADRLGDAVVRLYERHAELLTEGPERLRAAAIARSVAAILSLTSSSTDRYWPILAPSVEFEDYRALLRAPPVRGAAKLRQRVEGWFEAIEDTAYSIEDLLDLRPAGLVFLQRERGHDRAGGGSFETQVLDSCFFDAEGRLARVELFAPGQESEALARFDLLTTPRAEARVARRVRPNAATACADLRDAALRARDLDAYASEVAKDAEFIDHTSAFRHGRSELLEIYRRQFRTPDLTHGREVLATLGDSLSLSRAELSGSGASRLAFGPWKLDTLTLEEVDAQGRQRAAEWFGSHQLGDAVVCLYERYAALLPKGPERERAAAVARTVAVYAGPMDRDRYAATWKPDVVYVDHRTLGLGSAVGADAFARLFATLVDAASDTTQRFDDVLALRPDAWLVRNTNLGTDRGTGGAYERPYLLLVATAADGLVTHVETFDPDREAEALARFDALTAPRPEPRAARRVRPNAATANTDAVNAAIAARDLDAFRRFHSERARAVDHASAAVVDLEQMLEWWRLSFADPDATLRVEPIATLGDFLALNRLARSASASTDPVFEAGPLLRETFDVFQVDADRRILQIDSFGPVRLGEAVTYLYERHAELLSEGPERARAAAIARSIAALTGRPDLERWGTVFAPDIAWVDSRNVGTGTIRGADALRRSIGALLELTTEFANRIEDILAARSDSLLVRWTNSGTLRAGGGTFERHLCHLWLFAPDGRLARWEQFDAEFEAEALARFEALVVSRQPALRWVRPNPVTENAARISDAIRARDADAIAPLLSDDFAAIDHKTGASYGREGALATVRMMIENRDLVLRDDPIATLGERLALCHSITSSSGTQRGAMEVGPFETETIHVVEVDERGRRCRNEWFAPDRLADAITRLYERHAELLPEGPERARATAIARAVAVWNGAPDRERYLALPLAPSFRSVDHRGLALWSARGPDEYMGHVRSHFDLAAVGAPRDHELLALEPSAFLVRRTYPGSWHASGGAFEHECLALIAFGPDGLTTRAEWFEPDREAEALARFEALALEPRLPRFANAATRACDRWAETLRARDIDGLEASLAPGFRNVDRRRIVGSDLDREPFLDSFRHDFARASQIEVANEILATRGERLALARCHTVASIEPFGPSERAFLQIFEVDALGRFIGGVGFDLDDLDAAYAELDARYAAGEAAPHARTWATGLRAQRAISARDWEQLASTLAPDFVAEDHRKLALAGTNSREEQVASVRSLVELRPDVRLRLDHVLALDDCRSLGVVRYVGAEADGAFEISMVFVGGYGADTSRRQYTYDLDQLDAARARYEALGATAPRDPLAALLRKNAATAALDRFVAACAERDWTAVRALAADGVRFEDRRRHALLSMDIDEELEDLARAAEGVEDNHYRRTLVATAGDRVALESVVWSGGPPDGRVEVGFLWVVEVDEGGRLAGSVVFDVDDRRAAFREAFRRWLARGEEVAAVVGPAFEVLEAFNDHDRARMRIILADDLVYHDYRLVGLGRVDGADAFLDTVAVLWDLSSDTQLEVASVLAIERHGVLSAVRVFGTLPEGGVFETQLVSLTIVARGRVDRMEYFEIERTDAALARFAELRPESRKERSGM